MRASTATATAVAATKSKRTPALTMPGSFALVEEDDGEADPFCYEGRWEPDVKEAILDIMEDHGVDTDEAEDMYCRSLSIPPEDSDPKASDFPVKKFSRAKFAKAKLGYYPTKKEGEARLQKLHALANMKGKPAKNYRSRLFRNRCCACKEVWDGLGAAKCGCGHWTHDKHWSCRKSCRSEAFELAVWCRKCQISTAVRRGSGQFHPRLDHGCAHCDATVASGDCIHVWSKELEEDVMEDEEERLRRSEELIYED